MEYTLNSSYEHDETGWTCEDGRNHELMMEKRQRKLDAIPKGLAKTKNVRSKRC